VTNRKAREKEFHDVLRNASLLTSHEYDRLNSNKKWYLVTDKSRSFAKKWLIDAVRDKRVLDYCCGNGEMTIFIAHAGARLAIGIDISKISLENARRHAMEEGVESRTKFVQMDAELLTFGDDYFDIIYESGVLHHLSLDEAYRQMSRVLKEDGKCICIEALRHNPVFHTYRKMTPHLRTKWEVDHILGKKQLEAAKRYFFDVKVLGFFHLTSVTAVFFRKVRMFDILLRILNTLDDFLLQVPGVRWLAWQAIFELSSPIKGNTGG
jgi:ubiquinone/menaquinone biosynthesis C-methylase UbiE